MKDVKRPTRFDIWLERQTWRSWVGSIVVAFIVTSMIRFEPLWVQITIVTLVLYLTYAHSCRATVLNNVLIELGPPPSP